MKNKIDELKREYNMDIIAVIESCHKAPGEGIINMTCYVMDEEPWLIENNCVGFMADVVNEDWDIEESGSIGLIERTGCVFRKY